MKAIKISTICNEGIYQNVLFKIYEDGTVEEKRLTFDTNISQEEMLLYAHKKYACENGTKTTQ